MEAKDTLTQQIEEAKNHGYTNNFTIRDKAIVLPDDESKSYNSDQVEVVNSFRFDGMTNPADESRLLLIETIDGLKGTLIYTYGAKSSVDSEMIKKLQ